MKRTELCRTIAFISTARTSMSRRSPPAVVRLTIDDLIIRFGGGEGIGRIRG
jgi:hypothetical protein